MSAIVLGEYLVERELGGGGFGRVALVRSRRTGERHAVKWVLAGDVVGRQRFLAEVGRWLRLPAHPHLTRCRFVRAEGDHLLVFTDYGGGGSLADWIADGRLYRDPATVARVATEMAWGLDAAHAMGLPHLDLKPANVVLTEDGTARLTDFGPATGAVRDPVRLLELELEGAPLAGGLSAGLSPGYAAPEQAEDQPVGRAADVWSWAVCVLEMFAGERAWPAGALAGEALDQLAARERWRVPVPPGVVGLLRECLRFDPAARPRSMGEVAAELADRTGLGGRRPPRPSVLDRGPDGDWSEPRGWLNLAYETAGLDPAAATVFWPSGRGTRRSQARADLRALAEAARLLDRAGSPWVRARLRADAAGVALGVGDTATAAGHLRECVGLLDGLDDEDSRLLLAAALTDLAAIARDNEVHDRAIAVAEELKEHPGVLARALLGRAVTVAYELDLYDQALAAFELAGDEAGAARALTATATTLAAMGLPEEADARLVAADARLTGEESARGRARVAIARAGLAADPADALRHARAAIDLLTPLVRVAGRLEPATDLGRAWFQAGRAYERTEQPRSALAAYRAARSMLFDAVVREGHDGLAGELAAAYDEEARLAREHEDRRAGVRVAGQAVELWQRLADLDGPGSWTVELATAREKLGAALLARGDADGAREQFDEVLRLVPESDIDGSPRRRTLVATAHRQHGVLLRRSGDPVGACGRYQHALHLLADGTEPDEESARVTVLESLGVALGDAGHLEESVQVLQQSAEELVPLVASGLRGEADLAESNRRLATALFALGDYAAAADAAAQGLARYDRLIEAGRDDLVRPAARLRAARGALLHRLSDVEGAVAELAAAAPRLSAQARRGLDAQVAELRAVTALGPGDLDAWYTAQEQGLAAAAAASRAGRTREASRRIEPILGSLGWVTAAHPSERGHALRGQAGVHLGMSGMHARRNRSAHHGFVTAIDSFGRLVDGGNHRYVEDWARAYVGLASLLTVLGDDDGADGVVAELVANLAPVDPEAVSEWRSRANGVVSELRANRG